MNATPLRALAISTALVALALLCTLALPGCGGGSDPEACEFELLYLPDGRFVPAPNNCPPGSAS